jgi:hypothetical protein
MVHEGITTLAVGSEPNTRTMSRKVAPTHCCEKRGKVLALVRARHEDQASS